VISETLLQKGTARKVQNGNNHSTHC